MGIITKKIEGCFKKEFGSIKDIDKLLADLRKDLRKLAKDDDISEHRIAYQGIITWYGHLGKSDFRDEKYIIELKKSCDALGLLCDESLKHLQYLEKPNSKGN